MFIDCTRGHLEYSRCEYGFLFDSDELVCKQEHLVDCGAREFYYFNSKGVIPMETYWMIKYSSNDLWEFPSINVPREDVQVFQLLIRHLKARDRSIPSLSGWAEFGNNDHLPEIFMLPTGAHYGPCNIVMAFSESIFPRSILRAFTQIAGLMMLKRPEQRVLEVDLSQIRRPKVSLVLIRGDGGV